MKKFFNVFLAVVLMLSMATTVLATDVGFVPSIADKGAPEIVTKTEEGTNQEIIGYIVDSNNETVSTQYASNWVVTPVSEAYETEKISKETANALIGAYNDLSKENVKLTQICPDLEEVVSSAKIEAEADDLVVRDLFDVSLVEGEIKELLNKEDNHTITLTFELNVPEDEFLTAITKCGDKWVPAVKVVNNGDGTVDVTFNEFCPVVFLTDSAVASEEPPVVMDPIPTSSFPWAIVLVCALVLVIALVIIVLKRKKETVKQ